MRIIIIEDEHDKRKNIKTEVVRIVGDSADILEEESLRGGLKTILTTIKIDLILLDMSMPSFDITNETSSEDPESFAGYEIMAQMKLRNINIPVLIITQYKSFEKGSVSVEELIEKMKFNYSDFFKGTIYYNSSLEEWKKQLFDHMKSLGII
ncbi:response regulator [Morganella morganii]|uniref:response regulator n=1 Tax=Morganella morganii TaxID=582 RepID=UPI001BD99CDE|nr:response regulator [Morganella morganii]MBT0363409.1 hypothetical protein [Morganella morganii subsp. morganii]MBT0404269.1 hypothetical protein [Morganella morganii subsp. morganii]HCT9736635.1 hypothetical protein [Morganella morganii]